MDGRPTWTDCDEAGDYVVPNVLSPRDLVFRPDIMDETVPHTSSPPPTSLYPVGLDFDCMTVNLRYRQPTTKDGCVRYCLLCF